MFYEILDLSPTPVEEECAQVGSDNYRDRARKECRAFIGQLERQFGTHDNAHLSIKLHPHDFGSYSSVVVKYDPDVESAVEYAFNIERNLPKEWDDQARSELNV